MDLPIVSLSEISRTPLTSVSMNMSPYSFEQQVFDWDGFAWQYELSYTILQQDHGRILSGFFTSLRSSKNPFVFKDPSITRNVTGTIAVNGASQSGNQLTVSGPVSNLRFGDFFSISNRLYQLTSDPSGFVISFEPKLRSTPANGQILEINNPSCLLRLTSPVPAIITHPVNYSFSLSCIEAL